MFRPSNTAHDTFLADLHGQPSTSVTLRDPISSAKADGDFDADDYKHDEMWSHLSKILELQSEIAHMHVEMEGVGTKPAEGRRTTGGRKTGQDWESREGDGRGQSDEDEAREEEFSALSNKFTRRRAAIDGIMNKLDELSHALTTFHSLETPSLNSVNDPRQDTNPTNDIPSLKETVPHLESSSTIDRTLPSLTRDGTKDTSDPLIASSTLGIFTTPKLAKLGISSSPIRPALLLRHSQPLSESPVSSELPSPRV